MPVAIPLAIAASAASIGSAVYSATQGSPDYGGQAAAQEQQRQQAINQGTSQINNAFAGFTPDFYSNYAKSYTDFAQPQLEQQYEGARNQIGFNLANRNLLNSGTSQKQWSDLATAMGQAQQNVVDTGQQQAQQLQRQVESAKSSEIGTLYQSADPAGAAASATSTAASFAAPPTFAPLANSFANLLNQYYVGQLINPRGGSMALPPSEANPYTNTSGALPPISVSTGG
jgi:hypothetical protein